MVQARYNASRQFLGPFRGLNTLLDASQLPPEYASVCHNITIIEGRLRPRDPWIPVQITSQSGGTAYAMNVGGKVLSMKFWRPKHAARPRLIAKSVTPQGVGNVVQWEIGLSGFSLLSGQSRWPADFVQYGDAMYVLDGSQRIVRAGDPHGLQYAGIAPPSERELVSRTPEIVGGGGNINATVDYAITFTRGTSTFVQVESNPFYTGQFSLVSGQGVRFVFDLVSVPFGDRIDFLRIYRRNHSAFQTAWRLIVQLSTTVPNFDYVDRVAEGLIDLSDLINGPFAPYRNHPLGFARMGAMYRGRLFVDDPSHQGRVRFSEVGFPDYVHPDDNLDFAGDQEDRITGVISLGDQLYVGKPNGIHAHSGVISTDTNETLATGAEPIDGNHQEQRTRSKTGPENLSNGFILAGEPAAVHYARRDGLYSFDGIEDRILSDAVRPTWTELTRELPADHEVVFTYATDPAQKMLYVCCNVAHAPGTLSPSLIDRVVMAYGYANPAFSTLDDGGYLFAGVTPIGVMSCVATSLGGPTGKSPHTPLAVGTGDGWVLAAEQTPSPDMDVFTPYFEWRSGEFAMARGLRAHLYYAKWFLARRLSEALGLPPADPPTVELAAILNLDELPENPLPGRLGRPKRDSIPSPSDGLGARVFKTVDLRHRDKVLLKVAGTGEDVTLVFRKESTWKRGAYPGLGVIGWELDAELVGQR